MAKPNQNPPKPKSSSSPKAKGRPVSQNSPTKSSLGILPLILIGGVVAAITFVVVVRMGSPLTTPPTSQQDYVFAPPQGPPKEPTLISSVTPPPANPFKDVINESAVAVATARPAVVTAAPRSTPQASSFTPPSFAALPAPPSLPNLSFTPVAQSNVPSAPVVQPKKPLEKFVDDNGIAFLGLASGIEKIGIFTTRFGDRSFGVGEVLEQGVKVTRLSATEAVLTKGKERIVLEVQ